MNSFETLPSSAQTAYAELLTALMSAPFPARGTSYFTREVKGRAYWYLQYKIGASQRSHYIGPDNDEVRGLVARARALTEADAADRPVRERLVATCVASGLQAPAKAEARIYEALVQSGVFATGGVLVGSHAFLNLGNLLGVRWIGATRTEDIDVAHDPSIDVAAGDEVVDLEAELRKADRAFFAVPALDARHPSTTFKIRGKQLSVSLLTPLTGKPDSRPVLLRALRAAAEPLRFLDYLLEDSQLAAVPVDAGLLIRLPDPARFALHKLVVSQRRPAAFSAKSRKDIAQADRVLEVLRDFRPGDIRRAWDAAQSMGDAFMRHLAAGMRQLSDGNAHFLGQLPR